MTYVKGINKKIVLLVEKNLPRIFYQGIFFTEMSQNQMLEVKTWHFLKSFNFKRHLTKNLLILYP